MYLTIAKSFFSSEFGKTDIANGFECWRGYYQSVCPTQMGLSLNIDISATSFYKSVPVIEFAAEYLNIHDTFCSLTSEQLICLKKALSGISVEVTHREDMHRRYKITGLSDDSLSKLTFFDSAAGKEKRVVDYFRQRYKYKLEHDKWPCLLAGSPNRPVYLPMEVCKIVKGQRFSRKLNVEQVNNILKSTSRRYLPPEQRVKDISKMVALDKNIKDEHARKFGIEVMDQLTPVEARILPPPTLKYHDSGREKTCTPGMGAWNMMNKKLVNGGKIQNWACVSFSKNLQRWQVRNFCNRLVGLCKSIGMDIRPANKIQLAFAGDVEDALGKLKFNVTLQQLLLVVLPDDLPNNEAYGKIKRVCETQLGLVSQCCQPMNVQSCKPTYLEHVGLKINVKVGGRNTVLEDALERRIDLVTDKATIIFGADVTHPSPQEEDSSFSIAAVVASMDWPEVTKYRCLVRSQKRGQELIEGLYTQKDSVAGGMIRELLLAFYKATNRMKPHRIIFYRDGVSDGQFSQVLLHEVVAIRHACMSLEGDYAPPVTFVVVKKRHHTRLFQERGTNRRNRIENILPGTVVDNKICHPTGFDFYLCSHASIQGTSKPTHYHVLLDENKFSADQLQALTNNLCYTYACCTRSVSVVPPVYYAHLAADRARCYTDRESGGGPDEGTHVQNADVQPPCLPDIHEKVKDVMFYC